ncbi:MAG: hypothetical protein COX51_00500 [Syntrophobacteraceae bacterium CG23_combo_of_CG06-09_8_20_14_all_50_8]|nr:MAG: hypothetical protein COX51_00500 [Syntrophobacteraceae bacterium CG23_combo_of_CG06-09_8_20_14_all_50_8]
MQNDLLLTIFPDPDEFQKALIVLGNLGGEYELIIPKPALSRVALLALVMSREVRGRLAAAAPSIIFSGWVDYRVSKAVMPDGPPPEEGGACFQRAAIMVLGPCVADETKIRLIAHLEGDLGPVLPYLNAVIPQASYMPAAETLTYTEGYRMIALYRQRITIAKADDIVDAWMTLENIRQLAEHTWSDRNRIEPLFETRRKPTAKEIFKLLPETNCKKCGLPTCFAFAFSLSQGKKVVDDCPYLSQPEFAENRQALTKLLE